MICWSCQKHTDPGAFCTACGALQSPDDAEDLFAVLGVPARYSVDLAAAEAAYKELSRQVHPDRFATADHVHIAAEPGAKADENPAGMCCTITIPGVDSGSRLSSAAIASVPPVEAPIAITDASCAPAAGLAGPLSGLRPFWICAAAAERSLFGSICRSWASASGPAGLARTSTAPDSIA